MTTIRTEATEKLGKVKPNTRLNRLPNINSRMMLTPKTKVITSHPNVRLRDIKQLTKNPRNHRQLMETRGKIITKRGESLGRVKDPMRNLPGQINNRKIQIKEEKLTPSSGSIQRTEKREKLRLTMTNNGIFRQKQKIRRPSGHGKNGAKLNTGTNTQGGGLERSFTHPPSQQQRGGRKSTAKAFGGKNQHAKEWQGRKKAKKP